MPANTPRLLAGALILTLAACATDRVTSPSADSAVLAGAFATAPIGSDVAVSSYVGTASGSGWAPRQDRFQGGFMGGGLAGLFMGAGFGPGFGHGLTGDLEHLPDACHEHGSHGRMLCTPALLNGLNVDRSVTYTDAEGNVQDSFQPGVTDMIDVQVDVSGTITRWNNVTTTVQLNSERSVSGLATGSTQRVVNGTSAAQESSTGSDTTGTWTAQRVVGDTTNNVVIPVPTADDGPPIPLSGTIVRSIHASFGYEGETPATTTRREMITYDGTDTATVVITQNDSTRTCSLPLPHGHLICP